MLLIVGVYHLSLDAVQYELATLGIALAAWFIVILVRLRLVGRLESDVRADIIPRGLRPWIRGWLLVRFGLLGSSFLLLVLGVLAGVAQRELLSIVITAFMYLVWGRMLLDVVFDAAVNTGVILNRS